MQDMRPLLYAFARACNNVDESYYHFLKKMGMKESELCLMYALGDGAALSQKQIHEEWMVPKTTINTSIKRWQQEGYLSLSPIHGKRHELLIRLTPAGKDYVHKHLDQLYRAEEQAMRKTLQHYSPAFIEAVQYFGTCMKEAYHQQFEDKE